MFKFTPRQIPSNIVVIGCGGTGSRVVPLLAQFIRSITREFNPRGWLESPTIYLCDDDVIESKNLLRQNFIEADVGKYKSVVLAQRYSRAYGINIIPSLHRIEDFQRGLFNNTEGCPVSSQEYRILGANCMYLLCVDSAAARRNILSVIEYHTLSANRNGNGNIDNAPFIIDAGNEDNFGQVQFFSMIVAKGETKYLKDTKPEMSPIPWTIPGIPYPKETYQQMVDNQSTASCADLDQTLAINAAMATTMIGVVQNFYYVKPFSFHKIGISLEGGGYTSFNTREDLMSRMTTRYDRNMYSFDAEDTIISWYDTNQNLVNEMKKASEAAIAAAEASKQAPETIKEEVGTTAPVLSKTSEECLVDLGVVAAPKAKTPRKKLPATLPPLTPLVRSTPVVALQPLVAVVASEEAEDNEVVEEDEPF